MLHRAASGDRRRLVAFIAYVVATVAFTYPTAFRLGSAIPGDGIDGAAFLWNDWWLQHSIANGHAFFWSDFIYYPEGVSLVWHTHGLLNGILAAVVASVVGLVAAHNLLVLASFVLSAYGAFLLAQKELSVGAGPAFVAGLIFSFCPWKLAHLLGHVNLTSTQYVPFFVLCFLGAFRERKRDDARRSAIFAGLLLAANAYTDYTLAFFCGLWALFVTPALLVEMRRDRRSAREDDVLPQLSAFLVTSGIALAPLAWLILRDRFHGDAPTLTETGERAFYADLRSFVRPSWLHPWLRGYAHAPGSLEQTVTLGWCVPVLASLGAVLAVRRRRLVWVLTFVFFVLLSFGSELRWDGRPLGIPMPYRVLATIPVLQTARAPARFSLVAVLGAAMLAAQALGFLEERIRGRRATWLTVGAFATIAFEFAAFPFPTAPLPYGGVFTALAREPADSVVLDVPLAWRDAFVTVGVEDPTSTAAQVLHGKRRLGGIVARVDPRRLQAETRLPFVSELARVEKSGRPARELARRAACALAREHHVTHVLVTKLWRDSPAHRLVIDALPTEVLADDAGWIAYRVIDARCTEAWFESAPRWLDVTAPAVRREPGWSGIETSADPSSPPEWSWSERHAELVVSVSEGRPAEVIVAGSLYPPLVHAGSAVTFAVDGGPITRVVPTRTGVFDTELVVPEGPSREVRIVIDVPDAKPVEGDGRVLGFALEQIGVVPTSTDGSR